MNNKSNNGQFKNKAGLLISEVIPLPTLPHQEVAKINYIRYCFTFFTLSKHISLFEHNELPYYRLEAELCIGLQTGEN